ncbi:MAG: hypothetical protein ACOCP8_09180, partial [archaeon]
KEIMSSVIDVMVDTDDEEMDLEYEKIDEDFLRKYFSYARNIRPIVTKDLKNYMKKELIDSFSGYSNFDTRSGRSVTNIMYAIAKLRLHKIIQVEDFEEAIKLKKASLDSYLVEKDLDEFTIGVTNSDRSIINTVYKLVKSRKSISLNDLTDLLSDTIKKEKLLRAIDSLKFSGDIVENKSGVYNIPQPKI